MKGLEQRLLDLNNSPNQEARTGFVNSLTQAKWLLKGVMEERGHEALLLVRFTQLNHMDAPTALFFELERKTVEKMVQNRLSCPGGRENMDH